MLSWWSLEWLLVPVAALSVAAQIHPPPCADFAMTSLCLAPVGSNGVLRVTVMDVNTGRPVAGEILKIERLPLGSFWGGATSVGSFLTDATGRVAVPVGADGCRASFRIMMSRRSRFRQVCEGGERHPALQGREWAAGVRSKPAGRDEAVGRNEIEILLRVEELAQVSGIVYDPTGTPLHGEPVMLFRESQTGSSYFGPIDVTTTAADGSYGFGQIAAGRYRILAGRTEQWVRKRSDGLFDPFGVVDLTWLNQFLGLDRGEVFFPTYFPRAVDSRFATPVDLSSGFQMTADIRKVRAEVFFVEGTLRVPNEHEEIAAVGLEPMGESKMERPSRRCKVTRGSLVQAGPFQVGLRCDRLPEGAYRLHAYRRDGTSIGVASEPIRVERMQFSFGVRELR